jgi:hypothetical protein
MNDVEEVLRDARKSLVVAAEGVMETAAKQRLDKPQKSQLSHLVALCSEAACAEEIVNFIHYQTGRRGGDRSPWSRDFAEVVIKGIKDPLDGISARLAPREERIIDLAKVQAWRLYAVYLTRAFTYWDKAGTQPESRKRP